MFSLNEAEKRFLQTMGVLTGLFLVFFASRVAVSGTFRFWFFIENLALAWVGMFLGWYLVRQLEVRRWLSWQNIVLSLLWLSFLPNTWYVLTDFLHVGFTGEVSEIYDIALTSLLVINGFILGYTSLYLVHMELRKRMTEIRSLLYVLLIILVCSFAIYMGRDLRWNSWDVIANTGGILINITDRIVDPLAYPRAINVTGIFFLLLSGIYFAIWLLVRPQNRHKG